MYKNPAKELIKDAEKIAVLTRLENKTTTLDGDSFDIHAKYVIYKKDNEYIFKFKSMYDKISYNIITEDNISSDDIPDFEEVEIFIEDEIIQSLLSTNLL